MVQVFLGPGVFAIMPNRQPDWDHTLSPTPFDVPVRHAEMLISDSCVWSSASELDGVDGVCSVQSPRRQSAVQEVVIGVTALPVDS